MRVRVVVVGCGDYAENVELEGQGTWILKLVITTFQVQKTILYRNSDFLNIFRK